MEENVLKLDTLPRDVLDLVIKCVDNARDVAAMRCTCTHLRNTLEAQEYWRHLCHLEFHGSVQTASRGNWEKTFRFFYSKCARCMHNNRAGQCIGLQCGECCDNLECRRHQRQQRYRRLQDYAALFSSDYDNDNDDDDAGDLDLWD